MADLYWSKGAPGLYYLWNGPRTDRTRTFYGKVHRQKDGRYRAQFQQGELKIDLLERTAPHTIIANTEFAIRKARPGTWFHKEGF